MQPVLAGISFCRRGIIGMIVSPDAHQIIITNAGLLLVIVWGYTFVRP